METTLTYILASKGGIVALYEKRRNLYEISFQHQSWSEIFFPLKTVYKFIHRLVKKLRLHISTFQVPTFRSDVRYFELGDGTGWFGGGNFF